MSKEKFSVKQVSAKDCRTLLEKYHYLTKNTGTFKSGYNFGLYKYDELVGVCIFTGYPVAELAKGCHGLEKCNQEGLFELSRLVLTPQVQEREHNIASWFVSRSIRALRRSTKVRSILSYADCDHHKGTIYRACNFNYYGLTDAKKDFWIEQEDGCFKKHVRGKMKGLKGEWRDRSRKHRFLMVFDKNLKVLWEPVDYKVENK